MGNLMSCLVCKKNNVKEEEEFIDIGNNDLSPKKVIDYSVSGVDNNNDDNNKIFVE